MLTFLCLAFAVSVGLCGSAHAKSRKYEVQICSRRYLCRETVETFRQLTCHRVQSGHSGEYNDSKDKQIQIGERRSNRRSTYGGSTTLHWIVSNAGFIRQNGVRASKNQDSFVVAHQNREDKVSLKKQQQPHGTKSQGPLRWRCERPRTRLTKKTSFYVKICDRPLLKITKIMLKLVFNDPLSMYVYLGAPHLNRQADFCLITFYPEGNVTVLFPKSNEIKETYNTHRFKTHEIKDGKMSELLWLEWINGKHVSLETFNKSRKIILMQFDIRYNVVEIGLRYAGTDKKGTVLFYR